MAKKRGRSKASSEEEEMHNEQEEVVKSSEDGGEKPPQKKNKKSKSKSKAASEDASEPKRSRNNALAFESVKPPLSRGVLQFLENQKFHTMTPVQAATIPLFLSHKDVAVQACTGSGKTLSFLIPIVEMILRRQSPLKKSQVGAIVLSPTRELAHQTYTVAQSLCEAVNMTPPLLVVGGGSGGGSSAANHRPVTADLEAFQKTNPKILICTPGRLEDILNRYIAIDVSELDCLVLDEADVLMKMGFTVSLTNILSKLPRMRRTGLFSATQVGLKEWTHRAGLRNPVWVNVAVTSNSQDQSSRDQATPASLENYYVVSPLVEKFSRLAAFLRSHPDEKIIVFFLTCACVEFFGSALQQLLPDQYIELLHGKLVQKRREKAMERFRNCVNLEQDDDDNHNHNKTNEGSVLCCTDVAARGLDVTDVHWVVQFDAPQDPAFFIHRAGRAARAGRKGSNLVFLTPKEESYVDLLRMRKVPLSPLPLTEVCTPPEDTEEEKEKKKSNERQKKKSKGNDAVIATEGEPPKTRTIKSASDPNLQLPDMLPKLRDIVLKDREMLEKGTKAFTSYIRAYKEHQCAFIFRFASLDLGFLATSFCLLRLPKMPELRDILAKNNGKLPNFESAGPEVDIYKIPYLDKARESARQKRLQAELAAGGKSAKQIKAEQRKADKLQREKEQRKLAIEKGRNPDKKRGKNAQMMDEWDDLAKEERLYKKLRRGKISQEEFDEQMYGGNKKGKEAVTS